MHHPTEGSQSLSSPSASNPNLLATGARILLRQPLWADCEEFLEFVRQSRSLHSPWVNPPDSSAAYRAYLHRVSSERFQGFLACLRSNGAIAGVINFSEIIRGGFQNAFIGYYGNIAYSGEGYMTEALQLAVTYAFTDLKLHRLEANIQPENHRSIALVRRCGFHKEGFSRQYLSINGRWCDHERWAILAEDGVCQA